MILLDINKLKEELNMNYEIGIGRVIKQLSEKEGNKTSEYMLRLKYCIDKNVCFEPIQKLDVKCIYNMVLSQIVNLFNQDKREEVISDCLVVVCTIFDLSYNEAKVKVNTDIMNTLISTMNSKEPIIESNRFIDNTQAYFEALGDV